MNIEGEEMEFDSDTGNQLPEAIGGNNYVFTNCYINNVHAGNVINIEKERTTAAQTNANGKLQELATNLQAQLKASYAQEYASFTCLPETEQTEEETFSIKTQYSPLSIRTTKEGTKGSTVDLELTEIVRFVDDVKDKIVIEGDAGYGKTILARKLCYDWVKKENLGDFKFLFYISLRSFEHDSIFEYLRDDILKKNSRFGVDDVTELLRDERILIILDDLHVVENCELQLRNFFHDLPNSTFIVLSQPIAWEKYKKTFRSIFSKRLTLFGFNSVGTEQFVKKCFDGEETKLLRFKALLDSQDQIGQKCVELLQSSPLLVQLMCFLVKNKRVPSGCKITKLYTEIFDVLRQMYNEKHEVEIELDEFESILTSFGKLAFEGLIDDRYHFKQDVIDNCLQSELITSLGFLRKDVYLFSDKKKIRFYQPLHRTFLDYLGALYLSSLKDFPEKFDIEFKKIPCKLAHSKSTSETGSRLSLFVVFLSSLLGHDAHSVFLTKLNTEWNQYFKNFCDIMWLLWHSGMGSENISVVAQSDRIKCLDFDFLFRRDFKGEIWTDVLCQLFRHPKSSLRKLFWKYLNVVNGSKQCKTSILQVLSKTSVVDVELEKSIDSGSNVCLEEINFFFDILSKIKSLKTLTLNADIFVGNQQSYDIFFEKLFKSLPEWRCLEKLIINVSQCTDLCDTFFKCDIRKCNSIAPSKKQAKKKIPMFKNEHVEILVNSLEQNVTISELQLPRLNASIITLQKLARALNEHVRVVKLPYLEVNPITTVNPLFQFMLEKRCSIESIDLSGCKFTLDDPSCLSNVLKSNHTLKQLNLSRCLVNDAQLRTVLEGLSYNQGLKCLNLSSKGLKIDGDTLETLIDACSQSKIEELHLSGWIFVIRNAFLIQKIADLFKNCDVNLLCLKNALVKVNFHGKDFENVMKTLSLYLNSLNDAKVLDVRDIELQELQIQRQYSDGGYCSMSPEIEGIPSLDLNFISKDETDGNSDVVNKWKIHEIHEYLRISSGVNLLHNLNTFYDYKSRLAVNICATTKHIFD